jgi:hypothetical protein
MQNIERDIKIEQFIREYLTRNPGTDRLDAEFHDEFSEKFGGKRILCNWGSSPNLLAMKWLKRLYEQGILNRAPIGLDYHEAGFPNWAYSYRLAHPTSHAPDAATPSAPDDQAQNAAPVM